MSENGSFEIILLPFWTLQNSSNLSLSVNKQELKKIKQNYIVSSYWYNSVFKSFFVLYFSITE